ncbi:MAG: PBS lyase, partial [Pirellulaceae bacterium]|nr:PBS lyase [Pirellulaceae bacterium]
MLRRSRHLIFGSALCLSAALAGWLPPAAGAQDPAKERELIGVLRSDAPPAQKAMACKQLVFDGSPEAVPALAPLLADKELASWARIALEAIPGDEAEAALREAAGKLEGRLLIGTLNSLGARRDVEAVDLLRGKLQADDADVASSAAVALGRIGGDVATKQLRESLQVGPAAVRSAVAEGCILCAERLWQEGRADEAAEVYEAVRRADLPKPRHLEATRGLILARQAAGVGLLVEQLRSDDRQFFQLGLTVARELPAAEVTQALTAELAQTAPDRGSLLLLALA